jgi:hypothetical protein
LAEIVGDGRPWTVPMISQLSTTGTYLEGINTEEIISTVHARRAPMMHASAGHALAGTRGSAPGAPAPRPLL